ncbi:MAG: nuclear transport factor 2 family protein [Chloroflexi bacterium]|nr:nuclear transport factor 2 family protein [Chloroflexota bacterium]
MQALSEIDDLRAEVRRLSDREAIRDLFSTFASGMDAQDWDVIESVWADDAVFDHSQFRWDGMNEDVWDGKAHIMRKTKEGVSRHFTSHHIMTNIRIALDGDKAKATVYLHSVHLDDPSKPAEHGDHGAWYVAELRRTPQGWRISYLMHFPIWFGGIQQPSGPTTAEAVRRLREHLR